MRGSRPREVITFSFGPHANSFNLPIISVPKDLMRMSYITDSNNLRKTAINFNIRHNGFSNFWFCRKVHFGKDDDLSRAVRRLEALSTYDKELEDWNVMRSGALDRFNILSLVRKLRFNKYHGLQQCILITLPV